MTGFYKSAKISLMMSDDDKKLSDEDQALWDEFASDMVEDQIVEEENFEVLLNEEVTEETDMRAAESPSEPSTPLQRDKQIKTSQAPPQLDKRTAERLRKGKMPIERRIDLHGFNQVQAYDALKQFIIQSHKDGIRHVLVITGKGKTKSSSDDWLSKGNGILKKRVPEWLNESDIGLYILKYITAQPKDGGDGALYVYLKKNKG